MRTTRWGVVFALIFAGMIAAGQVGKAAVALPLIQRELGPAMLRAASVEKDNDLVFSFWGTYMPFGSAAMMLVGAHLDWQILWIVNGALALAYAPAILWLAPEAAPAVRTRGHVRGNVKAVLTSPGPLVIASAFGVYVFQYFAIIGLFPTLLVDRMGLSTAAAGTISAIAIICNGIGNLLAGGLMRLSVPLWTVLAGGFAFAGVASFGVFAENLPVAVVAAVACLILAVGGLIPASLFAATPRVARSANLLTMALGLIVQASNIGQLLGVPAMAAWVEHFGWGYAWAVVVATSGAGIVLRKRR
ncbi:MAG TPA: MFS transporter [Xanthobacteraceae bacterium]|nr:MFS transporter [Xanthobacteraceae bacterium]